MFYYKLLKFRKPPNLWNLSIWNKNINIWMHLDFMHFPQFVFTHHSTDLSIKSFACWLWTSKWFCAILHWKHDLLKAFLDLAGRQEIIWWKRCQLVALLPYCTDYIESRIPASGLLYKRYNITANLLHNFTLVFRHNITFLPLTQRQVQCFTVNCSDKDISPTLRAGPDLSVNVGYKSWHVPPNVCENSLTLEKLPPYGRLFSSSFGGLQPSAANDGALRAHFFWDFPADFVLSRIGLVLSQLSLV